ncbi:MAG TPA: hypothetical protein VEJ67_13375 [Candidatus Cybelea sp.]|nr:hypothetical protein [Candidatus Cybelea sp.]
MDLLSPELEETARELAAHLEDLYELYREQGWSRSRAISGALGEVSDWRELGRRIRLARRREADMNQRSRVVWIPGLASVTLASGALALLQVAGLRPHIVWMRSGLALLFYIPWLVAQPAFGATGAYLSERAGGSLGERLVAGIFPSISMLVVFALVFLVAIVQGMVRTGDRISSFTLIGLGIYILTWVVLPGLALTLGIVPFLRETTPHPAS